MIAQVGYMLKEQDLMSQRNVIGQKQMLMQLPHVTDMGHYRKSKFLCKEAHGKELTHAGQPCAICLDVVHSSGLHEILEQDSIRNVLSDRYLHGSNLTGKHYVRVNIVRVSRFLDP